MKGKRVGASRRGGRYLTTGSSGRRTVTKKNSGTVRLVVCGAVFVLIVMLKLLFPQTVDALARQASRLLGRDTDFRAAFAAVGRAVSGEESVSDSLQEAYTAVFGPLESNSIASNDIPQGSILNGPGAALADAALRPLAAAEKKPSELEQRETSADTAAEDTKMEQTSSTVYRVPSLPENASLAQMNLGFAYTTPVRGTLTSTFGWREHPTEGGSRFHYGLDFAAAAGTEIVAFADGEVYATGESSTLGKYIILLHDGDYKTLYAHCSEVLVTQGSVHMGEAIARVGDTGTATGAHLHFELQNGTMYFNPIYYVAVW